LLLYVDVEQWANRFLNWLQHEEIINLLKLGRYSQGPLVDERTELTVRREASLSAIDAGEQVSGRVDRLVVSSENGRFVRAEIIDFKTDALGEEEILDKALIDRHRKQLDGYRTLVSKHYEIPAGNVTCSLAFLSRPVVVTW
jgi:ATP-dependent exoDNAse (exonuclease V) beta subunit